jgi:CubicO group peptidase (beta-lactamase class C family)
VDIEAFFDGLVPQELSRENIAGTAIVVVRDGKILFSKGYGYADVGRKVPVSPETTLFRPGSVSKLFTWTAVMQQVERGKLDLDRDVNDYLDFKISSKYSKPITLRDLMTHSGGFQESLLQLWVKDAASVRPIGDYLKEGLPQRIYPPGTVPAYSNYGTTLAGYLVERASGQRFDEYVDEQIFRPLGMTHSTFRQPLPDSLKSFSPIGYSLASGPAHAFEFIQVVPAGASTVTANDMARFMIAHLQDGRYEGVQILRPETVRLMHSRQLENHPQMNAMTLGFYEMSRNGHRIIGHNGETQYFQSAVRLMPDAGVGFFITQNSFGKGAVSFRNIMWDKFLNRYFPNSLPRISPSADNVKDGQDVAGNYISSRRYETTIFKVLSLSSSWKVTANSDGTISVNTLQETNGQLKRFQEVGPVATCIRR